MKICIVFMIFAMMYSCNIRSQNELDLLKNLENKYEKYSFSSYDIYLKVFTSGKIDTSEIIDIYLSEIVLEDTITEGKYIFNAKVPWKYLNVYNKNTFKFQIVIDIYESSDIYFSNREYY